MERQAWLTEGDRPLGRIQHDVAHADPGSCGSYFRVARQPPLAPREAPRLGEWTGRQVKGTAGLAV